MENFSGRNPLDLTGDVNKQNITILEARENNPGKFHESGFTLVELEELPDIKDWRSVPHQNPDAEIIKFHK